MLYLFKLHLEWYFRSTPGSLACPFNAMALPIYTIFLNHPLLSLCWILSASAWETKNIGAEVQGIMVASTEQMWPGERAKRRCQGANQCQQAENALFQKQILHICSSIVWFQTQSMECVWSRLENIVLCFRGVADGGKVLLSGMCIRKYGANTGT